MRDTVSEAHPPGAEPGGGSAIDAEPERSPRRPSWPVVVVGLTVLVNLWVLRAEARPVQNLNDAAVHRSMVGWANDRIEAGHLPLDGWYPDLSLGSSRFHHYQSLPHVLTGTARTCRSAPERAYSLDAVSRSSPVADRRVRGRPAVAWGRWPGAGGARVAARRQRAGPSATSGGATVAGLRDLEPALGDVAAAVRVGARAGAPSRGQGVRGRPRWCWRSRWPVHLLTGYLALLALGLWVIVRADASSAGARSAPPSCRRGALLTAAWVVVPLLRGSRLDDPGRVLARQAVLRLVRREAGDVVVRQRRAVRPLAVPGAHGARRRGHRVWPSGASDASEALEGPAVRRVAVPAPVLRALDPRSGARVCCRARATCSCAGTCWACTSPGCTSRGSRPWPRPVVIRARAEPLVAPSGGRRRSRDGGGVVVALLVLSPAMDGAEPDGRPRGPGGSASRRSSTRPTAPTSTSSIEIARAEARAASTRGCARTGGPSTRSARSPCTRSC